VDLIGGGKGWGGCWQRCPGWHCAAQGAAFGGAKYGILKIGGFWRIGVCIAERIRREFAVGLRNYTPSQLSVLFETVHANAVVVNL